MAKLLEKALVDAIKERKRTIGIKQIMSSMENSKLVVISRSLPTKLTKKIEESAKNHNVPLIHFPFNYVGSKMTYKVQKITAFFIVRDHNILKQRI